MSQIFSAEYLWHFLIRDVVSAYFHPDFTPSTKVYFTLREILKEPILLTGPGRVRKLAVMHLGGVVLQCRRFRLQDEYLTAGIVTFQNPKKALPVARKSLSIKDTLNRRCKLQPVIRKFKS